MTDFLTTLAARTLGLPPVIQPMISSIFSSGLVVLSDYGSGEMGGEREYKESSSLYQFSSPNLPAISRLPLSQISTPASEFNNIDFNDEMGKMPRQQNIEPVVEIANGSTNELSESLPVQRFSEVKNQGSYSQGFATAEIQNMPSMQGNHYETSSPSEQQQLPIKSSQLNPDIQNVTLPFLTLQPTEKSESQSPTLPASTQLTQPSSAKTILPLTQFEPLVSQVELSEIKVQISKQLENISTESTSPIAKPTSNQENQQNITKSVPPLINQVQLDEVPVLISNQLENTSLFSKATFNQENQQNINQSILPLPNSQSITILLVQPLINLGITHKLPGSFIYRTAKTPSPPRNKISREFLHKSSNQEEIEQIAVIGRGQEILTERLIDSAIPVSSSNEVGKLDKKTKAKDMDNSKVKLSPSLVSTFQPSQPFTNAKMVVVKPLVDIRMNVNVQKQQTNLKSANLSEYLSQYAAVKNQPVVLPQQLSVYSQFHTQMESRESGQTDRRGEAVTMKQAPTKTIQVTIGRIEVRCNQTASQTKHTKPNRSEPQLSLQDYLKKRQGGN